MVSDCSKHRERSLLASVSNSPHFIDVETETQTKSILTKYGLGLLVSWFLEHFFFQITTTIIIQVASVLLSASDVSSSVLSIPSMPLRYVTSHIIL